jgi:DNA-binding GntR family transcriptional regulator
MSLQEYAAMEAASGSRESVGESTYRRIRTDILFGRLAPDRKLRLERMKDAYGVSVSTLRELLTRLTSEGLIVAEGLRGFQVAPVSATGLREVAAMRLLLECHALKASLEKGELEWEGRVVAAHHKLSLLEKRMAAGDKSQTELWKRYDREFHHALISACDSTALLETHASIYDKYLRYQMVAVVFRGDIAVQEHRKLLKAALARDWPMAHAVLVQHVQDCVEDALAAGKLV